GPGPAPGDPAREAGSPSLGGFGSAATGSEAACTDPSAVGKPRGSAWPSCPLGAAPLERVSAIKAWPLSVVATSDPDSSLPVLQYPTASPTTSNKAKPPSQRKPKARRSVRMGNTGRASAVCSKTEADTCPNLSSRRYDSMDCGRCTQSNAKPCNMAWVGPSASSSIPTGSLSCRQGAAVKGVPVVKCQRNAA